MVGFISLQGNSRSDNHNDINNTNRRLTFNVQTSFFAGCKVEKRVIL
jgi:hypothetical protein